MAKKKINIFMIVIAIFLVVFSIALLYLLFWSFLTSVKAQSEFRLNKLGFPQEWMFSNFKYVYDNFYVEIFGKDGKPIYYMIDGQLVNSILYVVGCSMAQTLAPCIMAYAVTKFSYKFNGVIKTLVFIVMALPITGAYASEIDVLTNLQLYDTIWGVWIQKTGFATMYFFVFCAAFQVVSKSFYEAAYMDGANEFVVMVRIAFPMIVNTFWTVFLIHAISFWNDYQTIVLYLPSWPTLSYGLFKMSTSTIQGLNNVPMRMAGCMMIIIPTLIVYIVFNRRLLGNISMGGVKE